MCRALVSRPRARAPGARGQRRAGRSLGRAARSAGEPRPRRRASIAAALRTTASRRRVRLAREDDRQGSRVALCVAPGDGDAVRAREPEVLRRDRALAYLARLIEDAHARGRAGAHLVEAVLAADDPRAPYAELAERSRRDGPQGVVVDADELVGRARRVGERAEGVEDRAHAELRRASAAWRSAG